MKISKDIHAKFPWMPRAGSVIRSPRRERILQSLAASLAVVGLPGAAFAQTIYQWQTLADGNASGIWQAGTWNPSGPAGGSGNTADFSGLDVTADSTVTLGGAVTIGRLVFGDTDIATAASWTLASTGDPLTLETGAGAPALTVNALGSGKNATISASLAGTQGLVKDGAGVLVLNGANTYTGGTTISAGTLQSGNELAFGAAGEGIVLSGGTLAITTSAAGLSRPVTVTADSAIAFGNGSKFVTGSITGNGRLALSQGSGASATITFGNGATAFSLAGFTGTIALNNRFLRLDTGYDQASGASTTWEINGDKLSYRNGTNQDLVFELGSLTGTGTLGGADGAGTGRVIWRVGALGANATFAGAISDGNTRAAVEKTGAGAWTLTGASGFTGGATVTGGTLLVDGAFTAAANAVSVAAGAALGGKGSIAGSATIADGGILLGTQGQTLSLGSLALGETSQVNVTLGTPGSVALPTPTLFHVAGDLTLDGQLNVANGGGFGPGIYRLFDYGGALLNNGLAISTLPDGANPADWAIQTSVAGQVNLLSASAPESVAFWRGGAGTWSADPTGTAWTDSPGANTLPWTGGFAIFQSPGAAITVSNASGAVNFTGAQFAADGYTVSGGTLTGTADPTVLRVGDGTAAGAGWTATVSAAIAGDTGLTKTDLGTLVLVGANTYSGATLVESGRLLINGDQSAATGGITVAAGATLGGSGTAGGAVTIASGATLAGASGQTLTLAALTLNPTSQISVALGTPGSTQSLFSIGGNLTLDGQLSVTDTGGFGQGIYRLFNYGGSLLNNGLLVSSVPAGFNVADWYVQASTPGQVNLVYGIAPDGLTFWRGTDGTSGAGTWSAAGGGTAWTNAAGTEQGGWTGGFAVFSGPGGAVSVDGSAGAVEITGIQFAATGYTVAGLTANDKLTLTAASAVLRVGDGTEAGASATATINAIIEGAGGIEKTDLGTLTLTGANTYAGDTKVSAGTLNVDNESLLGSGGITLNGGELRFTGQGFGSSKTIAVTADSKLYYHAGSKTVSSAITGANRLEISQRAQGSETITFTNSFAGFTGTIALQNQFFRFGAAYDRAGGAGAAWEVNGILGYQPSISVATTIEFGSLAGAGTLNGAGGTGLLTYQVGARNEDTTFSGVIAGANTAITKVGSGRWTLASSSTFGGPARIQQGTLALSATGYLDGASEIHVAAGATFDVSAHEAVSGAYVIGENTAQALSGGGQVKGTIYLAGNGRIAPGDLSTPATLTVDGLYWGVGGTLEFSLGADNASSDHLALGHLIRDENAGLFLVSLLDLGGLAEGATYDLISFETIDGFALDDFTLANTDGLAGIFTLDDDSLSFTVTALPVPEPGPWALLLAGSAALLLFRRKDR